VSRVLAQGCWRPVESRVSQVYCLMNDTGVELGRNALNGSLREEGVFRLFEFIMKYIPLIGIVAISILLSVGCSNPRDANAAKPEMTRCQDELSTIPEVAALSKARSKKPEDAEASVSGMEIALTINGMVRSTADPDRDRDDWCYTENTRENFAKLLNALKDNGIPPTIDFLSGDSLDQSLQAEWLSSGNLIGSLTFKGRSPKKGTAQEFIDTLSRNEQELAPLLTRFQQKQKYFRYPALKLGLDTERPREIRAFLRKQGFTEVPATIDSRVDSFSQPYCAALSRGDKVCASFISATFKSILLDKTLKARAAAQNIVGRDIKQILMIKANQLTSDLLDELLRSYKAMGVRFISVDEALTDPFYATEDVTRTASRIIWETKQAQGVKERTE
jgi:peptidoglycan/xylan/chitin deacetylase (PgdA/CDA1 family)